MAKVLLFLKKLPFRVILMIPIILLGLLWVITKLTHKDSNTVVQKKLNDVVKKLDNKQDDLAIEASTIQITKNIEIEKIEEKRKEVETQLETIHNLPRRKRAEELLKLHEKLKKERESKK